MPEQLESDAEEVYWEIEKFIRLALKANPNVLECFYSPLIEICTPLARELVELRSIFLSRYEANYAIGGWRPLGFVSLALQKGYRLGFQSSSDHISTHMSYCKTSRTREAVMEAFRKRRIYGSTDNILADVRCGEHFMGEEFSLRDAPVFKIRLEGSGEFATVSIIRDGASVYTASPGRRDVSFEWKDPQPADGATHYYYVRGEQKDGQLVWVSPMWIRRTQ